MPENLKSIELKATINKRYFQLAIFLLCYGFLFAGLSHLMHKFHGDTGKLLRDLFALTLIGEGCFVLFVRVKKIAILLIGLITLWIFIYNCTFLFDVRPTIDACMFLLLLDSIILVPLWGHIHLISKAEEEYSELLSH